MYAYSDNCTKDNKEDHILQESNQNSSQIFLEEKSPFLLSCQSVRRFWIEYVLLIA